MSRRLAAGAAIIAGAVAFLATGPAVAGAGGGGEKAPNRLLVRGQEFDLTLSRSEIGPGPALIQFQNDGEDPHDLQIRKQKGGATRSVGELEPGALGSVEIRLQKGARYQLWCSLLNHRDLGMEAKLKVKRKQPAGP